MAELTTSAPAFCLIELASSDAAASLSFYKRLFGWEATERLYGPHRRYWTFTLHGDSIAGLFELSDHERHIGRPAAWNTRVAVDAVADTAQRAQSLGGRILAGPYVAGDGAGEYARIVDPLGATFELWKPIEQPCAAPDGAENTVSWFELSTPKVEASVSFYTSLFGWSSKEGFNRYVEFAQSGRAIAGVVYEETANPIEPAHWRPYIRVANADATMTSAKLLGATVVSPAHPVEGVGLAAILRDPQGAKLSVVEYATGEA